MRNYFRLTRFLFKCGLGSMEGKNKGGKRKRFGNTGNLVAYIILGICMIPLAGMLYQLGNEGYELLAPVGLENLIPQLVCVLGAMVIFLFAVTMVISIFYMTSDLEALLPLPLYPWQIVGAKMTMALVYEYLWVAFFVAPILAGYGVAAGGGVMYWIVAVIGCLAFPIVPLCYAGVIVMAIMRLFKGIRNKDLLSGIGLGFSIIIAFGISAGSQFFGNSVGSGNVVRILTDKAGLILTMGKIFPNLVFMSNSLLESSILQILLFVVTSLLAAAVFLFLAQKIYLQSALGMSEASDKKRVLTKAEKAKANRVRKPVVTYTMIELKKLFRTPVYLYNCVIMCLIWPLFFLIPLIFSLMASGVAIGTLFTFTGQGAQIREFFGGELCFGIVSLAVAGIVTFVGSFNMTVSTSISREGKNYYIMKYLPMSYRDQIKAKIASGSIISVFGTIIYIILIEAVLVFLGMSFLMLPLSIILDVVLVSFLNYIQMFFELAHPKLVWDNEAMAVKQNLHAAIASFLELGIGALFCGAGVLLRNMVGISSYIVVPLILVMLIVLTFFVRRAMYAYGEKRLAELED